MVDKNGTDDTEKKESAEKIKGKDEPTKKETPKHIERGFLFNDPSIADDFNKTGYLTTGGLGLAQWQKGIDPNLVYTGSIIFDPAEGITLGSTDYLRSAYHLEDSTAQLKKEKIELLEKLQETQKQLRESKEDKQKLEEAKKQIEIFKEITIALDELNEKINKKLALGNLIRQVKETARQKLLEDESFRDKFETTECNAYVLSIDIRRSTELMLKAKDPLVFQNFVVSLCIGLSNIITENYGIFDKFTGDGILAFFPDFYSGQDAGLLAVKSAIDCHAFFDEHYKQNRKCFVSIMKDVGLGIGIDFGLACLARIMGTYTVVGTPVVYACRYSGGNAGETLLNQVAYEQIFNNFRRFVNFEETSITIKNEGNFIAYKITSNGEPIEFKAPEWDKDIKVNVSN